MRAPERGCPLAAYHRGVSPLLIAAVLIVGLLALPPARRLFVAGRSTGTIATYFMTLCVLGLFVALAPGTSRLLVPVLIVLYVVPFIAWRRGLARLMGREVAEVRPPPRNVTPPDSDDARGVS